MRIALGFSGGPDPRRANRKRGLGVLALAVALAGCGAREPSHGGKRLSAWFKEAVEDSAHRWDVQAAFEAFEGDAVPFLIREIVNARKLLVTSVTNPPSPWLMNPAGEAAYRLGYGVKPASPEIRRERAYALLDVIARRQHKLAESGTPSRKPAITNAFPLLHEAFANPRLNETGYALRVIASAGPLAAEFAPAVLNVLTNAPPSDPMLPEIIFTLGRLGEATAIPHLTCIVADSMRPTLQRQLAAQALEQYGAASQPAAPAIAGLLLYTRTNTATGQRFRVQPLVHVLASVGQTPEPVVPVLEEMAVSTNDWERVPALIALWNRRPDDPALRTEIVAVLTSTNPGPALTILTRLGTNAAVFASQIRPLTNHPLPHVRVLANRYLRALDRTGP